MRTALTFVFVAFLCGGALVVDAGAVPGAGLSEEELFFETKIRPILAENCFKCHGPEKEKSGLRLDSMKRLLLGGDGGAVVVPGDVEASRLARAIQWGATEYLPDVDLEMPPKEKLPEEAIAHLLKWIAMGAPWPAGDAEVAGAEPGERTRGIWEDAKTHWSFQKVRQVTPPKVKREEWVRTEVDRFVLARLEGMGMGPSEAANEVTLMRRIYLDLVGMPPTPEETERHLKRGEKNRARRLVDDLLEDPRYGERWGRHWLDVARYGDSKGPIFGETRQYPFAYTYRDYVVAAFNDDKPFDEFIVEQLAADKVAKGKNDPALAALGFLTVHRRSSAGGDVEDWADRVDTIGRGLLGLTVACARCHDHKYDPIPTADFYSLFGVVASCEEPEELPVIGGPAAGSKLERDYKKLLAEEDRIFREYREENYARLMEKYRVEVGDYLLVAHEGRELKGNALQILGGKRKLNPYILARWHARLAEAEGDAVLGAWVEFAAIGEKGFEARAAEVVKGLKGSGANARVVAAFAGKKPKSIEEVAEIYEGIFGVAHEGWKKRVAEEKGAKAFEDAALEEIRQLLYGKGSPGVIPAGNFKMLERKVYLKLMGMEADRTLRLALHPGGPQRAMVLRDKKELYDPKIFLRGNKDRPGDAVPRRFLEILSGEKRPDFKDGSGRLELAKAIVDPGNPLTARVMVNRVWMQHFGQGLVDTPSDFGLRSDPPTHPELLDWLAADFMEHGWSVKRLHRLIMNAAVYQQASHGNPEKFASDPDNKLLWRFNRRRLEFEAIHDSLLAVSGKLDTRIGGPAVTLVADKTINQGNNKVTWEFNPYRRAIYGAVDRIKLPSLLVMFDFPNPDESSARRNRTTVPTQGLYMMNSPFVMEMAEELVARPEVVGAGSAVERIRRLYGLVFSRPPTEKELLAGRRFIEGSAKDEGGAEEEPVAAPSAWAFGFAGYDMKTAAHDRGAFDFFPYRTEKVMQGGAEYPDKSGGFGWMKMTATGGHAGTTQLCVVRRWTSPVEGVVNLAGVLRHDAEQGNGVRATVYRGDEVLGQWKVHDAERETGVKGIEVKEGDVIDFVVDGMGDGFYDGYGWAPIVALMKSEDGAVAGMSWSSKRDFGLAAAAMGAGKSEEEAKGDEGAWERFAHVLLMSNEFAFMQ